VALGRAEPHRSATLVGNILVGDGQPIYMGGYGWKPDQTHALAPIANLTWDRAAAVPLAALSTGGAGNAAGEGAPRCSWDEWQKSGRDLFSIVADPGFVNPERPDQGLRPDSPALRLGFRPIDTSTVGPRPKGQRE
jgi:hypothetical protein